MSIVVRVVDAAVTTDLRRAVLRPHWAPGTPMFGDDDPSVIQLAAVDGEEVVGACGLVPAPWPHGDEPASWQLRAMATAPERRGEGVGALVLTAAADEVVRRGGRVLWCRARSVAVGFYERCGWVVDTEGTSSRTPGCRTGTCTGCCSADSTLTTRRTNLPEIGRTAPLAPQVSPVFRSGPPARHPLTPQLSHRVPCCRGLPGNRT